MALTWPVNLHHLSSSMISVLRMRYTNQTPNTYANYSAMVFWSDTYTRL